MISDKINGIIFRLKKSTCLIALKNYNIYRQRPLIVSNEDYKDLQKNEVLLINYYTKLKDDLPFKLETFKKCENYTLYTKPLGKITFHNFENTNMKEIIQSGEMQLAINGYIEDMESKGLL